MGLLQKAEQKKRELLNTLTKEKKQYIDHVSKERKKLIYKEIKKQRAKIKKRIEPKLPRRSPSRLKKLSSNIKSKIDYGKLKPIKEKEAIVKKQKVKELPSKIREEKGNAKKGFDISAISQAITEESTSVSGEDIKNRFAGKKGKEKVFDDGTSGSRKDTPEYIFTGIQGFDALLEKGIPRGSSVLLAGGAGSGKTIFGLQTVYNHCLKGDKCIYLSFEESEEKLMKHMQQFGWNASEMIKKKRLMILKLNPFEVTRSVDALLMQAKGELMIDVEPVVFPKNFKPDMIVLDSLSAIASAFVSKEDSYRVYIEQLFNFFGKVGATSFLITETEQIPKVFSASGVEEFLADGVVVLYAIKRGNVRESAIEVLKLRGAKHQKKIVAMQITDKGIVVYPEQEVFGEMEEGK